MKLNKIIFHPIFFGLFPVIALFESSMNFTSAFEMFLPISIILGISISLWLTLKIILKNGEKSALIVSFCIILFFVYGPTFFTIDNITINGADVGKHRYLLIPFFGILFFGLFYLVKTKKKLKNLTNLANVISLIIVVVMLVNITTYNLQNTSTFIQNEEFESVNHKINNLPDIYFIILDSYPGKNSLKEVSNFDNSEFLDDLRKQGFFIQEKSFSNYAHTYLSIPSMLNMKYLNYLGDTVGTTGDQTIPYQMGSDNQVMNFAKSLGYLTVSFDSGWGFTRDLKSADWKLCGDNQIFNSEFMITLVKNSMLNPIYVKIFETDKIEQRLCIFEKIPKIKEQTNQPVFVFAHIFSPHPPYMFGPNGEIRQLNNLDPHLETKDNLDKEAFVGQLQFVNKKILDVTSKLLNSEKQPIIIILSDHGTAFLLDGKMNNWENPTIEMIEERMETITFIFLPDVTENIFSESITPINIFRILYNYYFETDFEILEDRIYFAKNDSYDLLDVTDMLKNP